MMPSKRPPHGKRQLSKQKCEKKRLCITATPPPIIFSGKLPGTELAKHWGVGDGAVSKAGKGAFHIIPQVGNFMSGMWVGTCFAQ